MRPRSNSAPLRPRPFSADPQRNHLVATAQAITSGMTAADHTGPPLNQLAPADHQFHIKGSMAAMMHGANVTPGDLDLVVGSFPKAKRTLQRLGYPPVGPMNPRIQHPPHNLPPVDVLHNQDWGMFNVPTSDIHGVRVTSLQRTLQDLRDDPREDKQLRNERLREEIIRAHTRESPF